MAVYEINTTVNPFFLTIPDVSGSFPTTSTLAAVYNNGAVAADQTLLIQAGKGGPVIFKANAAATGTLFDTQTNGGISILTVSDTPKITIAAATVFASAAVTASGTSSFDLSGGSGIFSTPNGAITIGSGNVNVTGTIVSNITPTNLTYTLGGAANNWNNTYSQKFTSSTAAAIGTAQTVYSTLTNTTAAALNAQQFSPVFELAGQGWDSTAGSSKTTTWGFQTRPVQTAGNPAADLVFWFSTNAGAYAEQARLSPNGSTWLATNTPTFVIGNNNGFISNGNAGHEDGISFSTTGEIGVYINQSRAWRIDNTTGIYPGSDLYVGIGYTNARLANVYSQKFTSSTAAAIGTAQTVYSTLTNTTAAAAGAQQYSPVFELAGFGWKTSAGNNSQSVNWGLQTRPVQSTNNPTGDLVFWSSINAAAYVEKAKLTSQVGTFYTAHFAGTGNAPSTSIGNAAQLGTGPSSSAAGDDSFTTLTVTIGTTPSAFVGGTAITVTTITYTNTWDAAPSAVILVPMNAAAAAAQSGSTGIFFYVDTASISTGGYIVKAISAGAGTLTGSTAYVFGVISGQ